MAAVITFNVTAFRAMFPAFANAITYPDLRLQSYWDMGTCYISDLDYGWLQGACRTSALNLMCAHLVALSDIIASGETPGLVNSAGTDKVSVSLTPPPVKNQWQWWLNLTPYGAQLLALLTMQSAGGFYIGGLPEKSAFRKVGGIF